MLKRHTLAVSLLVVMASSMVLAQGGTGALTGTVSDSTGAVLRDAPVCGISELIAYDLGFGYCRQMFDCDATAIVRLRRAGAILVAKLAMLELAGVGQHYNIWTGGQVQSALCPILP